ncbi:MAG: PAS domain-containing sensor histidine kinase, partial [Desulfobacterales bacterium]|nr:PAS domain-containing sensor histidine kinase [Desulfobacterales bacterium]
MEEIDLRGLNIAIMGGSYPCKEILQLLLSDGLKDLNCTVVAVADSFSRVEGVQFAKKQKLFTTINYNDILKLEGLDLILKLGQDQNLSAIIEKASPLKTKLLNVDHS